MPMQTMVPPSPLAPAKSYGRPSPGDMLGKVDTKFIEAAKPGKGQTKAKVGVGAAASSSLRSMSNVVSSGIGAIRRTAGVGSSSSAAPTSEVAEPTVKKADKVDTTCIEALSDIGLTKPNSSAGATSSSLRSTSNAFSSGVEAMPFIRNSAGDDSFSPAAPETEVAAANKKWRYSSNKSTSVEASPPPGRKMTPPEPPPHPPSWHSAASSSSSSPARPIPGHSSANRAPQERDLAYRSDRSWRSSKQLPSGNRLDFSPSPGALPPQPPSSSKKTPAGNRSDFSPSPNTLPPQPPDAAYRSDRSWRPSKNKPGGNSPSSPSARSLSASPKNAPALPPLPDW